MWETMANIKTIQEMLMTAIFEVFERMYYIFSEPLKGNGGKSGGAGEFHLHAPTDPDVTVSRHPALIIQPPG